MDEEEKMQQDQINDGESAKKQRNEGGKKAAKCRQKWIWERWQVEQTGAGSDDEEETPRWTVQQTVQEDLHTGAGYNLTSPSVGGAPLLCAQSSLTGVERNPPGSP